MLKIKLLLSFSLIFIPYSLLARSYPVKEVSKTDVECKFTHRENIGDQCKRQLPIINDTNYEQYKNNKTYRLIYSVLWGASYKGGWDIGQGGHGGVDIATSKGTPLYSIGKGEVTTAKYLAGRGNVVVIKHNFNGKNIHSVYAHMQDIIVNKGDTIDEGEKIGKIGNTGNSWGNHVHFQLDINKDGNHPRYYKNCRGSRTEIVNNRNCPNQLFSNTTDPIEFLETNGAKLEIPKNEQETQKLAEEQQQEQEDKEIDQNDIISRKELRLSQLELFLARYKISTNSNIPGNVLNVGEEGNIILKVENLNKPFNGSLPMGLNLQYNNDVIKAIPNKLISINNGKRKINIKAKSKGTTKLQIRIGGKIISTHNVRVIGESTTIKAERGIFYNIGDNILGTENWGLVVMQDKANSNIIGVPYEGNFTINTNNNVKICKSNITSRKELNKINNFYCSKKQLTNKISFSYNNTLKGLKIFKILPINKGKIKLSLRNENGKNMGTSRIKYANLPKDINQNDKYYKEIIYLLKNGFIRNLKDNFFGPDITIREKDAKKRIKNTLPSSGTINVNGFNPMTRLEFVKQLSKITGYTAKTDSSNKFRDVSKKNSKYANIFKDMGIKLDKFGDNYFQPNKELKRKEAAYILYTIKNIIS